MSYATPRLHWDRMRDGADGAGRPALEVPAELSALDAAALALLRVRLAWRCGVADVEVRGDAEHVVALVGTAAAEVTSVLREQGDRALSGVAADAAAGWTAGDEDERRGPVAWR